VESYNKILKQQVRQHAPNLLKKHGIVCKQMQFGEDECQPLYFAKPHWTNRFDEERESTIGIFCSIWTGPTLLKEKKFAYNIHSKAIRKLPGYKLTSQQYAREFRNLVKSEVLHWPNISLAYGPTTLLQGKDTCELTNFAEKIEERIFGFFDIHHHIDNLLEKSLVSKVGTSKT